MQAGFLATVLAMLIAVPIGLVAGYYRGWVDSVIARVDRRAARVPVPDPRDRARRDPRAVAAQRDDRARRSPACPGLVRITRGETLALREADFVPAAIASGAGDATIIFRHILPNMTSTLHRAGDGDDSRARSSARRRCRSSASASSRRRRRGATMLHDAQSYLYQAPRLAIFPGLAIVLAALAFNLLGDGLRDVLDPRTTR